MNFNQFYEYMIIVLVELVHLYKWANLFKICIMMKKIGYALLF